MEKRFKHIYFELTNICSRRCSFCPEVKREKLFISKNDAFNYLEQIKDFTSAVYWHVQGEPLLHPDFKEITSFASKLGLQLKLTTNATHLNQYADYLSSGIFQQINFSIQSLNEVSIPERQKTLNDIADFTIKTLQQSPDMYINFRYWQDSTPDLSFFAEKFNIPQEKWLPANGRHSVNITGRLYCTFDRRFIWPADSPARSGGEYGSCKGLIDHCGILCDGRVVPCCLDANGDLTLGNLRNAALAEILASHAAEKIADNFRHNFRLMPICRNCNFAGRFDSKQRIS